MPSPPDQRPLSRQSAVCPSLEDSQMATCSQYSTGGIRGSASCRRSSLTAVKDSSFCTGGFWSASVRPAGASRDRAMKVRSALRNVISFVRGTGQRWVMQLLSLNGSCQSSTRITHCDKDTATNCSSSVYFVLLLTTGLSNNVEPCANNTCVRSSLSIVK